MNINKIVGWILIFLGVTIILYSLYSCFNIFTARTLAPKLFSISLNQNKLENNKVDSKQGSQEQMQEVIRGQLKEIIPSDYFPRFFNLISWSIAMGIFIFGGAQIANLGTRLVKKIK